MCGRQQHENGFSMFRHRGVRSLFCGSVDHRVATTRTVFMLPEETEEREKKRQKTDEEVVAQEPLQKQQQEHLEVTVAVAAGESKNAADVEDTSTEADNSYSSRTQGS